METLIHLSWRLYLVVPMMMVGVVIAGWGAKRGGTGLLGAWHGDPAQLAPLMVGFRALIIGLALIGIGASWTWHILWLFIVSLATAGGETLETSLILFALRHGRHLQIGGKRVHPGRRVRATPYAPSPVC